MTGRMSIELGFKNETKRRDTIRMVSELRVFCWEGNDDGRSKVLLKQG